MRYLFFICVSARLVIEIDGSQHYDEPGREYDRLRTQYLESQGLTVLRYSNADISSRFERVCKSIHQNVQRRFNRCPSLPQCQHWGASPGGGGKGALRERVPMINKTIYALGFFDGVHLGHGALLKACRRLAEEAGCRAGVVTFEGHPEALVLGKAPALINTPADRERLLRENYRMDAVVSLPFDRALMEMPWRDFFRLLADRYGAAGLVCGHDFRFGYRGQGNAELLREACCRENIPCVVVPEQKLNGITLSSTHIRSLLEAGEVEQAAEFLGHPHILTGKVVSGRQLGRTIGIPTANVLIPEGVVIPKRGVYAGKCLVEGKTYLAVTNIGSRPTVEGHQVRAESWLLDFDGDLYGKEITLEFYGFLRPEQKFASLEELKGQIRQDAAETREYFVKTFLLGGR